VDVVDPRTARAVQVDVAVDAALVPVVLVLHVCRVGPLHDRERQLVFTAPAHPNTVPGMDDRIKSRLEGGLVAELGPPDKDVRRGVLERQVLGHDRDQPPGDRVELLLDAGARRHQLDGAIGEQLELVRAEGDVVRGRLKQGLRQVKAAVGAGGVSMVVEVAPWSRIPEARALLVPRDD